MKYGIIANPAAGNMSVDKKHGILKQVAEILGSHDCVVEGLDTKLPEEFRQCAADLSKRVGTLASAGGDGTFHDVINSVDSEAVLAYLPFGSGNAVRYTLRLPSSVLKVAERIRDGEKHSLDLILCDDSEKAIFTSVGFESLVLNERKKYSQRGFNGFNAYALTMFDLLREGNSRFDVSVTRDGDKFVFRDVLSLIVTKSPFYGYGMKVVPQAKFDDGNLHLLSVNVGLFKIIDGMITSFIKGNKRGDYFYGGSIGIATTSDVYLQTDGTVMKKGTAFKFDVLPGELKMRY